MQAGDLGPIIQTQFEIQFLKLQIKETDIWLSQYSERNGSGGIWLSGPEVVLSQIFSPALTLDNILKSVIEKTKDKYSH